MAGKENSKVKEREFICECIKLYSKLPSLWNVKSKEYHDRIKKYVDYETMLSKYREMFPQASKDDVKRKFNSLRTNYRKEHKKHLQWLQSMKSGSSADEIYEPTLWYYKEMFFLQDQESAPDSQSSMDTQSSMRSPGGESGRSSLDNNYTQEDTTTFGADQAPSTSCAVPKTKAKHLKREIDDALMQSAPTHLGEKPDEYQTWALSCASDLKKMEPTQQILAKTAIATITMEGQSGLLHRNMALQSQHRTSSYRQMLEEFILMYRGEPCLWHTRNRDYYDRTKRNAALDRLLEKCREVEPSAVRDDISKKINSLRTAYNKEKIKVKEAEQAGRRRVPKLWYYGLMTFLDDKNSPALARCEEPEAEGTEQVNVKEEYVDMDDSEFSFENTRLSTDQSNNEDPIFTAEPKRRKSKVEIEYNDTIQSDDSHVDASTSRNQRFLESRATWAAPSAGDRHELFAQYITCKLRELPKEQLILAEKLINEVLFEAECCHLTMTHKLTK